MSNKQLYEKQGENYVEVYPLTHTENITDTDSGKTLDALLQDGNHLYLTYDTNAATTRLSVPSNRRRFGLWISYMKDDTLYTEAYIGATTNVTTDSVWSSDSNWQEVKIDGSGSLDIENISESEAQSIVYKAFNTTGSYATRLRTVLGTVGSIQFIGTNSVKVFTNNGFDESRDYDVKINDFDKIFPDMISTYIGDNITLESNGGGIFNNSYVGTILLSAGNSVIGTATVQIPAATNNQAGLLNTDGYNNLNSYDSMIMALGSILYQLNGQNMNNDITTNISNFRNKNFTGVY